MALSVELGLILLFSILGGVLAVRFKQPSVLGLILIGAIVGPNTLGFIKDTSLINISIEIGAILLLFTVGIEFSLQRLLNLGLRVVLIAALKLGFVFLISYYSALFLGFSFIVALYIGVILSITSTVIVIKILDQKGLSKREELPLLVAILILEDIFGVFALTFFSRLNTRLDLSPLNLFTSLMISLTVMILAYLVLQRLLKPALNWLVKYSTEDTITFTSLGLCGGMSYLASLFNLSPSVGAFLAGNIVSSLPNSPVFQRAIHPFILTFTSLFFFSIGTLVNFNLILGSLSIVLLLFLVNILSKFFSIGFGSYLFTNFNGKQAVFSGIAMLSVGEFSLLIARESAAVGLGIDLVSLTSAIIVLSSISMSALITHYEKIYNLTARIVPARVKENTRLASTYLNSVSWSMFVDKTDTRRIMFEWRKIVNNIVAVFFVLVTAFFFWHFFQPYTQTLLRSNLIVYAITIFIFSALFFPALNIMRNTSHLLKDILGFFVRIYPSELANEKKIFRNIMFLLFLFVVLVLLPGIFLFIQISLIYHVIVGFLIAIFLGYAFRASHLIHSVAKRHENTFDKFSKKYKLLLRNRMKLKNNKTNAPINLEK